MMDSAILRRDCSSIAVSLVLPLALLLVVGLASEASAGASACLLQSRNEPCALLKEDLVRKALGDSDVPKLEARSHTAKPRPPRKKPSRMPPSNVSSCTYKWPSDMKRTVQLPGNKTMTIPRNAEVWLVGIVEYPEEPLATFENTHRTPTAEELAMLNKRVDERLAKAQAEGKVNEMGRNVGKDLAKQATEGIQYTAVSGIGDAARWESKSAQLSVLVDAVKFDVHASVSENAAENERTAQAIATALIEACE